MHISVLRRDLRTKSSPPSASRLFFGKNNGDDVLERLPLALEYVAVVFGVVLPALLSAINANCNEEGVVMVGVLGHRVGVLGRGGNEELRGGEDATVGVLGRDDSERLRKRRMLLLLLLLSSMGVGEGRYKGGTKVARPCGSELRRREEDMVVVGVTIKLIQLLVGVDKDMLLALEVDMEILVSNVMLAVSSVS
jgi:hypothetical protein